MRFRHTKRQSIWGWLRKSIPACLAALCLLLQPIAAAFGAAANTRQAPAVTVYVGQATGSDITGNGGESSPYQTLERAAQDLTKTADGGSVLTNTIVLTEDYRLNNHDFLKESPVPVTLMGKTAAVSLTGSSLNSDHPLYLYEELCLRSITVYTVDHIYSNGHDITLEDNVTNPQGSGFYLYGSGQNDLVGGVGKIAVNSGKIARIVGYVRSKQVVDAQGLQANITVGGTAYVSTIVAGNASGEVKNADVTINVTGGTVVTLVGGNQGHETIRSPYSGKTTVNISGGTVTNVLGAGSGRVVSIPTYAGELAINVTGGKVQNIYGAGSAAYVVSEDPAAPSSASISVTGGTVDNIFAAGKGGDTAVVESAGKTFPADTPSGDFGSLTGTAHITVGGNAVVTGSVYASGEGYHAADYAKSNAYLNGEAFVTVSGNCTIKGNVYGGGKGVSAVGFEECARVTEAAAVHVRIEGGRIEGNVYGGGQVAKTLGESSVSLSFGAIGRNLYGGGENGLVEGKTAVHISGGTVNGSVYGGALGATGERLVYGGSTVNMSGGWVRGNLYGGSELSDDGPADGAPMDMVFVNLTGGTVDGNVFGGGYRGTVNGSTHLHIGAGAPGDCSYYAAHPGEIPGLAASELSVGGSVYAGGDYGGDTVDYSTITVTGTSHVYIDGTGYAADGADSFPKMAFSGGVFGSGASCDAGSTRLVTLKNFGAPVKDDGGLIIGATQTLTAIQRADRVLLLNAHVQLTGQSDIANSNQTELYSLNRIGNHGENAALASLGTGLVLQGGSTAVLESAVIEIAALKSLDASGSAVTSGQIAGSPNTIRFDSGTVLRVSYTGADGLEVFGPVSGYAYILAGDTSDAYAYARVSTDALNPDDGGFISPKDQKPLAYNNVGEAYRYWQIRGENASSQRHTVLTAQTLQAGDAGYNSDGYAVAAGSLELPPAPEGSFYTIQSVTLPTAGLTLTDAGKDGLNGAWMTSQNNNASGEAVGLDAQKAAIAGSPLSAFGLLMRIGGGFSGTDAAPGKVISNASALPADPNTVIGQRTAATDGSTPRIHFYLTYWNDGISVSKSLGTAEIELRRDDGAITILKVELLTKASALANQTVELYATQSGSYAGQLIIPSGASRTLRLTGVASDSPAFVAGGSLTGYQFSVSMQPEKNGGWSAAGLMTEPYELGSYVSGGVSIGTTDSRYQAPLSFTLQNSPGFTAKDATDQVVLTLTDSGNDSFTITLNIHWKVSVVSRIQTAPGKQYNGVTGQAAVTVSQKSAFTAAFTLGETAAAGDLCLELRTGAGSGAVFPAGTQLTLLGLSKFYIYTATGNEPDGRIDLIGFKEMWNTSVLSGNIAEGETVMVIVDLNAASLPLSPGDYSLHLRNDTSADAQGADFTINNSEPAVVLSGGDGYSKGVHPLSLSLAAASDTRLTDGATAAITLADRQKFPEGIVFTYKGNNYSPIGGTVYIPLTGPGPFAIVMDSSNSSGLPAGDCSLTARIFPTGQNAGAMYGAIKASAPNNCRIAPNPSYGLDAALESGNRIVTAGAELAFAVTASLENTSQSAAVQVLVQKKTGGAYEDAQAWAITGLEEVAEGQTRLRVLVAVPADAAPGTYRLLFKLGDQTVPYNIMVQ